MDGEKWRGRVHGGTTPITVTDTSHSLTYVDPPLVLEVPYHVHDEVVMYYAHNINLAHHVLELLLPHDLHLLHGLQGVEAVLLREQLHETHAAKGSIAEGLEHLEVLQVEVARLAANGQGRLRRARRWEGGWDDGAI